MANIKADFRTRIGVFDKKAEVESSDPCAVVEDDTYVHELPQELQRTISGENLAASDAPNENKT